MHDKDVDGNYQEYIAEKIYDIKNDENGNYFNFQWYSKNPKLQEAINENYLETENVLDKENYLTIKINASTIFRFICPESKNYEKSDVKINLGKHQTDYFNEYTKIYAVSKRSFIKCELTESSKLIGECINNNKKKHFDFITARHATELLRDFYFITTSTGNIDGFHNKKDGLCKTKNLRLHLRVLRESTFDEISEYEKDYEKQKIKLQNYNSNIRQSEEFNHDIIDFRQTDKKGTMYLKKDYNTNLYKKLEEYNNHHKNLNEKQFDKNDNEVESIPPSDDDDVITSEEYDLLFNEQSDVLSDIDKKNIQLFKEKQFKKFETQRQVEDTINDSKLYENFRFHKNSYVLPDNNDYDSDEYFGNKKNKHINHSKKEKHFITMERILNDDNITKYAQLTSTYDRVRLFDSPFAYLVINKEVNRYCSYCLQPPIYGKKLMRCGACEFACYCNKECQKLAWKTHRAECRRLKAVFPNLPLTEVLFLSRIIDKVLFLERHGDHFGWERYRKFSDIMSHKEDILNDKLKIEHFKKLVKKMEIYRKEEMIPEDKFFDIYCRTAINSHSIHTNAGSEVGIALDLGVSIYDHSCRPNCSLVFDGFKVYIRPLTQSANPYDPKSAFISYIDVGRSRYRRQEDLKTKWYFDCKCERCIDPKDDILTSLKCKNMDCDEPIITHELGEVKDIECPKCKKICDSEYVKKGQELMKSLPSSIDPTLKVDEIQKYLDEVNNILHNKNIYVSRLTTALLHMNGTLQGNIDFVQKQVYENYKLCFPTMDRHNGFQLLHIVKSLIEQDKRNEAIPYAFDAMTIFEVCFGMQHPYYLQTLALWTFLEKKIDKTNEELFSLMNFESNAAIDISKYIGDIKLNPNDAMKMASQNQEQIQP
ncbi:Buzidau [Strongyloides ratti]|uniref:Buzidau n=1 Tax=Strongyloides ratti TaxID=34506 RepID=A0A090KWV8_STRRB|nr:Buzidau [Strongyloides ratti]CEF60357.1 Buzidau [Strongyloides ratti]